MRLTAFVEVVLSAGCVCRSTSGRIVRPLCISLLCGVGRERERHRGRACAASDTVSEEVERDRVSKWWWCGTYDVYRSASLQSSLAIEPALRSPRVSAEAHGRSALATAANLRCESFELIHNVCEVYMYVSYRKMVQRQGARDGHLSNVSLAVPLLSKAPQFATSDVSPDPRCREGNQGNGSAGFQTRRLVHGSCTQCDCTCVQS